MRDYNKQIVKVIFVNAEIKLKVGENQWELV